MLAALPCNNKYYHDFYVLLTTTYYVLLAAYNLPPATAYVLHATYLVFSSSVPRTYV